jgi:hypothetical protein
MQAALRRTTETLAHELAEPTGVAPEWSELEWRIACAVASMHGVSPLLAGTVRWEAAPDWREFLEDQKAHTLARHRRIQDLLRLIDESARIEGVAVVGLKGAELHARGLYLPGERPMADIDLLVQSADLERTSRMLQSLGFPETYSSSRHRVFVPRDATTSGGLGEHADNHLKIELHERIAEPLPIDITDITDWVFPAQPRTGLNGYPSKGALMSHLLLHAAGAMTCRALRLLHLHDIALLSRSMTDEDWDAIVKHCAGSQRHRWALPPLQLTARYYTRAIPTRVLVALAAGFPRLSGAITRRQTLTDVSLSRLRIDAFPGIQWSRSASEMARYVMSRVHPSRETLELRKKALQLQSATSTSRWHHLSQFQRMLRWVMSRPVRAETIYSIRMALTQSR